MRPLKIAIAALMFMAGFSILGNAEQGSFQVPQSIRLEHQQIISQLQHFAESKEPVASTAQKALAIVKEHYAKEEEFVLPPLSLLPRISKGEISKDMEPAIAMADRTKASLTKFETDHIQITSLMNELIDAGKEKHMEELVHLATRIAGQSLNDIEVAQPATIMIGDYLRQKLLRQ